MKIRYLQVPALMSGLLLISPHTLLSKHIIFDLGNVLVKTNKYAFARRVGLSYFLSYVLIDWHHPKHIHHKVFDVLNHLGVQDDTDSLPATHEERPLPALMCQWLAGHVSSNDLIAQAQHQIQELNEQDYFISNREKALVERVITTMFSPSALAATSSPIPEGLGLLKFLKDHYPDDHTFYVLSNWDPASFALLQERPEMQALFHYFNPENIFISGHHHDIKPHASFYQAFLEHYHLDPAACVFIDDQPNNITGAEVVGITGIQLGEKDYSRVAALLVDYLERPTSDGVVQDAFQERIHDKVTCV